MHMHDTRVAARTADRRPAVRRHDAMAQHPTEHRTGAHHGAHGADDQHAGHDPELFRRRFWTSLLVTIPLVVTSHMIMDWFGYSIDFVGMAWLGPVLGSFVFWWG